LESDSTNLFLKIDFKYKRDEMATCKHFLQVQKKNESKIKEIK